VLFNDCCYSVCYFAQLANKLIDYYYAFGNAALRKSIVRKKNESWEHDRAAVYS